MVKREELAQELARNGLEPPAKFVQNDAVQLEEVVEGCLPQVDISLLTSPCVSVAKAEAIKLSPPLDAVNHGMSREFMDTVRGVSHDFFQLPLEEKSKYARPDNTWQGYGFDKRSDDYGSQDWTDRLMFKLGPEAQRNFNDGITQQAMSIRRTTAPPTAAAMRLRFEEWMSESGIEYEEDAKEKEMRFEIFNGNDSTTLGVDNEVGWWRTRRRKGKMFFCLSEKDKVVRPVKGLVNVTTKPPKYKKVTNYELSHVRNPKLRALVDSMKL
ncbi:Jasmonate-induced oxygenase 4 [Linum grandiflorum]